MDDELCREKHLRINERLEEVIKKMNKNSDDIDCAKTNIATLTANIENLITTMDSFINLTKWGMGLFISGCVGFFFFAIQKGIL